MNSPPPSCSTPTYRHPATVVDSLDCSLAFLSSILLGSPSEIPRRLPQSLPSCRSSQVPCVFSASDQVSDEEVPIPHLYVPPPQPPSAHAAAALLADCDKVPILHIPPCSALVSCDSNDEVGIPHILRFLARPRLHVTSPPQPLPMLLLPCLPTVMMKVLFYNPSRPTATQNFLTIHARSRSMCHHHLLRCEPFSGFLGERALAYMMLHGGGNTLPQLKPCIVWQCMCRL
jgi:hypothetical protein